MNLKISKEEDILKEKIQKTIDIESKLATRENREEKLHKILAEK